MAGLFVSNRFLKGVDPFIVMFFNGFFGILAGIIYVIIDETVRLDFFGFLFYTPRQYIIVLFSCLTDFAGGYAGLVAAQSGTMGFIGLIGYTQIVYAIITDLCFFDESLQLIQMLAASVILLTTITVSVYNIFSVSSAEKKNLKQAKQRLLAEY